MTLTTATATTRPTPPLSEQLQRLIDLGLPELAGISAEELRSRASALRGRPDSILVVGPAISTPDQLATLLHHDARAVGPVDALTHLDAPDAHPDLEPCPEGFSVIHGIAATSASSPYSDDATPLGDRRPLTTNETLSWLLQQPAQATPSRARSIFGPRRASTHRPRSTSARHPRLDAAA
ncbi:DUF5701 family protein [Herbiconiux sp. CPCC 205716]|uniref:DUF5701 family protein n=1 Tax=Herbiconiux gentiana TaxID=2970912 RepID=A0ABT2GHE1_9MICO|nr:DUF5701 family protein [Herbiconiux gentiana]MCS5715640.1 DUF5701 family protein [Herbiconiux gentiana]